ncbi:response regulator transcription factor [Domibacillus sp. A3M-37]|uniref:response regulator transcription factor n=1 Tax=Domibacillus sp. A3M-37 TaxID=2962037 RepID=UPI0020B6D19D|nr:response regulator transcription factor [Domibacillus sp. A3M-37]MCP3762222.1 response regulator transcription factor [Domibacillus sp. A3M-37]
MTSELCKVLIVDDELLIRQGIKHYIQWEQEGFKIVGEASNGQEALSLIEAVQPHIVMTDIVMPIMDGEELTKIIRAAYPRIQVIVLSSFGEFDYVRSTFQQGVTDYILKPKLEGTLLLKALQNAADKIPSFQLVKRTQKEESSASFYIKRLMEDYSIEVEEDEMQKAFPYKSFFIISLQLKKSAGKSNYIKEKLRNDLQKQLPDSFFLPIQSGEGEVGFLVNIDLHQEKCLVQVVEHTSMIMPELVWSVSDHFSKVNNVKRMYEQQAAALKRYSFYFPDQSFFHNEGLPAVETDEQSFQLTAFTDMLKRSQLEEAIDNLLLHVDKLSRNYTNDIQEFKRFLSNIIFNVTLLVRDLGCENAKFYKDKYAYFASIDGSVRADEAIRQLMNFLTDVKQAVYNQSTSKIDPGIKKIMDYIDQHYDQPLTLTEVASRFHFNPSYLSTYFSNHSSEGFSEYVTKVRIEKAVDLLQQRHIFISEISGKVGYADHSYFCKVFKKVKGMSPSSYRKQFFL